MQCGLRFEQQKPLPVIDKQVRLDCGYRLDFVVEEVVVVELKAIASPAPIHQAQLISYLKLGDYPFGLLLDFNGKVLKDGIRRIAGDSKFSVVSVGSVVK